ncbi:malate dehydrogenase [Coriobacteriia bacterium Es71-Z0120]|uniref:malate dehydrogenase n=1 Tax=Parvivirga hydrogeniphila TaxID=2939460 RepID=UPI002260E7E4|nr:malate dehydrogenase [Parvivirga hydrogeniphila]MCL4079303.1 malate dehydrogenase [Parvivirga hydrogeniphila]
MSRRKVTIVGAGQVGATAAYLLALKEAADVVLVDVADGVPQGKALDMMHARRVGGFDVRVVGTNGYDECEGSDVVVITAGLPRRPGMTREDLLKTNGDIVRSVITEVVRVAPTAVVICVTNPLDVMTYLAWRISGMPRGRVLGMGGVLDSSRFAHAIAEAAGVPVADVDAMVIGAHGDTMLPLVGRATVAGRPLCEVLAPDAIEEVVRRTVNGGADVVALLKSGSAFYAPGASVAAMVEAVLTDARRVMPTCAVLDGEYGLRGVSVGVPAVIGAEGVVEVLELDLADDELAALRASAAGVSQGIAALGLGE